MTRSSYHERTMTARYLFIDLLRFAAAVFMVQGHVFDALLSPLEKARPYYYLHDVAHGFVPPLFFFLAGAAFSISTIRRWDVHHAWGTETRRRVLRFLMLIAIGYALHLPFFSLRKILSSATPAEWAAFLQVDATQCIGVTLLLLQAGVKQDRPPWGGRSATPVPPRATFISLPCMSTP